MSKTYRVPDSSENSYYYSYDSIFDVGNDDPYTQECVTCHNELPDDDMTQCQHCDGWYCSDGCYESHYERTTGRRYGR